jgi:hypothetical protein
LNDDDTQVRLEKIHPVHVLGLASRAWSRNALRFLLYSAGVQLPVLAFTAWCMASDRRLSQNLWLFTLVVSLGRWFLGALGAGAVLGTILPHRAGLRAPPAWVAHPGLQAAPVIAAWWLGAFALYAGITIGSAIVVGMIWAFQNGGEPSTPIRWILLEIVVQSWFISSLLRAMTLLGPSALATGSTRVRFAWDEARHLGRGQFLRQALLVGITTLPELALGLTLYWAHALGAAAVPRPVLLAQVVLAVLVFDPFRVTVSAVAYAETRRLRAPERLAEVFD